MIRRLLAVFALVFATSARATWYEATSNHFIVYSEGSEQDARDFAGKLERFRFVLKTVRPITEDQPSGRLRVFLLANQAAVQRMAGGAGVAGYYIPEARGLMLVGTRHRETGRLNDIRSVHDEGPDIDPENVLFHEYTHHFTFQYFPATYPVWYSEGFAEFWGQTAILPGDVVEVGAPANYRYQTSAISAGCRSTVCSRRTIMPSSAVATSSCFMRKAGCWCAICSTIRRASGRSTNICA